MDRLELMWAFGEKYALATGLFLIDYWCFHRMLRIRSCDFALFHNLEICSDDNSSVSYKTFFKFQKWFRVTHEIKSPCSFGTISKSIIQHYNEFNRQYEDYIYCYIHPNGFHYPLALLKMLSIIGKWNDLLLQYTAAVEVYQFYKSEKSLRVVLRTE